MEPSSCPDFVFLVKGKSGGAPFTPASPDFSLLPTLILIFQEKKVSNGFHSSFSFIWWLEIGSIFVSVFRLSKCLLGAQGLQWEDALIKVRLLIKTSLNLLKDNEIDNNKYL